MKTNTLLQGELLSAHTSFQIGGPADYYAQPKGEDFPLQAASLLSWAKERSLPHFILGYGTNVLANDEGFPGLILDTRYWDRATVEPPAEPGAPRIIRASSGMTGDQLADFAEGRSLAGLEFLAGFPGSIGGAVYMNARCYDASISDVLESVEILDETFTNKTEPCKPEEFDYKTSPYQKRRVLILSARFRVRRGNRRKIHYKLMEHRADRITKGHFCYPCAGSVFKNDRRLGKPVGQVIQELKLRGTQIGGARIADYHGNFIINTGGARAADVKALIELMQKTVKERKGVDLEPEIVFL
ncbi:MAG: UDP-N-acetylmuramate dehydrogenase [Spirochaetaceae bacterium]|jgi:UDP-N-acetylmuramate dehydrogenase|nr:UDP-N-acetylmuramate dehydrogenase [Spirochaetaceae bacterium]